MNTYETIFVTRPTLSDEESEAVCVKMEKLVKDKGATVNVDRWGRRKLAYEVKGCREGSYFLFNIKGESSVIQDLEARLKLEDGVIRHLTVRTDTEKGRRAEPPPAPEPKPAPAAPPAEAKAAPASPPAKDKPAPESGEKKAEEDKKTGGEEE